VDAQSLIIQVYHFLQKQTWNFARCVKYAFDNYILEKDPVINHRNLLQHSESMLADQESIEVKSDDENDTEVPCPVEDITNIDSILPTPFIPIDKDAANFILHSIHDGKLLEPGGWINDECINYYMDHVLEPMAIEAKANIQFITTYFFQRLFFDNRTLSEAPEKYAMNFHEALPYWKEGDQYIIPINVLNEHWALVTIDCPNRIMAFHDSLGSHKGWDGTVFMDVIFNFMKQFEMTYRENEMSAVDWKFMSSKDMYKWNAKTKRFLKVPQNNGFDCGIFILKYAELFIRYPEQRNTLHFLIRKHLPDRSLYKKHFLGLYVEFRKRQPADKEESPRKRKKRHREEPWGTETSFKRTRSERDRDAISLRESTEILSRVHVTTPQKAEKLSDNDSAEDEEVSEATSDPIATALSEEEVSIAKHDEQSETAIVEVTINTISVQEDNKLAVAQDDQSHNVSEIIAVQDDEHLFDTDDDDKNRNVSDIAAEKDDENLFDTDEDDQNRNVSEIAAEKVDEILFDTDDEISDLTHSTQKKTTDSKATNPHVLAGVPHSYKHVVDLNKYNEASFDKLIEDYNIAIENLKVFFQLPLGELLYDPPKSMRSDLLKLHYRHEDFRDYVHKHIEDELAKHRNLLKKVKFYTAFDGSKFKFDGLAKTIRGEIKKALGNFPHDRDVKSYPITTFTDVLRDMPVENTTIMESPPPVATAIATEKSADETMEPMEDEDVGASQDSMMSIEVDNEDVMLAPAPNPAVKDLLSKMSVADDIKDDDQNPAVKDLLYKMPVVDDIKDDDISYIGMQLAEYKHKFIHSKHNRRLCDLVILSHETNLPKETENTYFRLQGFPNLGNTCFINSVLQCLFRISYFQKLLNTYVPPESETPGIMTRLKYLYNAVNAGDSINEPLKMVVNVSKIHRYINLHLGL